MLEAAGLQTSGIIKRGTGGIANHVYRVDNDYIVRIGSGGDGKEFGKSCGVMREIEGRLRSQKLHFSDDTMRDFEFPIMMCEYLEV